MGLFSGHDRIAREQRTIEAMLHIYCAAHHQASDGLCADCSRLLDYASRRLDTCPFQARKPACNHCQVHCYAPHPKAQIKAVMRFAGPRMLLPHPLLSLAHLLDTWRAAPALERRKRRRG